MSSLVVIGYTRCSLQEQATDGVSLEAQQDRIKRWCEATGAVLIGCVADSGVSGTLPLSKRPGGSQIVKLLDERRPDVDAVVVARLDRLGRDAGETLTYLRRFTQGRVGLVSVADR